MTALQFTGALAELDVLIREGQVARASAKLRDLVNERPREVSRRRLEVSQLARRAGLVSLGLRLLEPAIQGASASPQERVEYAMLLHRRGAHIGALRIADPIDAKQAPEALLVRAFCHLALGSADRAVDALRSLVEVEPRPYENLVARVNLALALLEAGESDSFLKLASQLEGALTGPRLTRLRQHLTTMRVRHRLVSLSKDSADWARLRIEESVVEMPLSQRSPSERLTVGFWYQLALALSGGSDINFKDWREKAEKAALWGFRRMICEIEAKMFPAAQTSTQTSKEQPTLDLLRGLWCRPSQPARELSDSGFRLLLALAANHDTPQRWATLFERASPGLSADLVGAQLRIHQRLRRLRRELAGLGCPIVIESRDGWYHLKLTAPVALCLPLDVQAALEHGLPYARWLRLLEAQGQERLQISDSSRRRLRRMARERGWPSTGVSHFLVLPRPAFGSSVGFRAAA